MNRKKWIVLTIFILVSVFIFTDTYKRVDIERIKYESKISRFVTTDKDAIQYNIDVVKMTDCVSDYTSRKMRGFSISDKRVEQYKLYVNWLDIKMGIIIHESLQDIRDFGVKILGDSVHTNFGVSYQYCMDKMVMDREEGESLGMLQTFKEDITGSIKAYYNIILRYF
jgi:hypothetical protein